MDTDAKQSNQNNSVEDIKNILKQKAEEITKLESEYEVAKAVAISKEKNMEELWPQYELHDDRINELVDYRNELKKAVNEQNKFITETTITLEKVKSALVEN